MYRDQEREAWKLWFECEGEAGGNEGKKDIPLFGGAPKKANRKFESYRATGIREGLGRVNYVREVFARGDEN